MHRKSSRSPLSALLSGLMLVACGGAPEEAGLAPFEEPLGSQESALCSGTSVSGLTISGVSSWGGELAGNGSWAVAGGANAVRLEYYVNGVLKVSEERTGTSGTWYFSTQGMTCGTHTFEVRAYPMVIDSAGNRTTCWSSTSKTASQSVTQACPTASLSCSRSGSYVNCTGSGSGGVAPLTPFWQERIQYAGTTTLVAKGWYQGNWSKSFYCPQPTSGFKSMSLSSSSVSPMVIYEDDQLIVEFKVRDSSGMESPIRSSTRYACGQ